MSELNVNDLHGDELKKQAEVLDIQFAHNISDEKLREKVREALGQSPSGEGSSGAGDIDPEPKPEATKKTKRYKIKIHKDGKDKQPVPLACNGKVVRVMRGHAVTISEGHYNSLKNAIKVVQTQNEKGEMEQEEVQSYPFEVLEIIEG